jgi:hypothetical protein
LFETPAFESTKAAVWRPGGEKFEGVNLSNAQFQMEIAVKGERILWGIPIEYAALLKFRSVA